MKRPMFITVRGKQHEWCFAFDADDAHIGDWRADGLEVFVIEASVPEWVAAVGLARPWSALQSFWQWLRIW